MAEFVRRLDSGLYLGPFFLMLAAMVVLAAIVHDRREWLDLFRELARRPRSKR